MTSALLIPMDKSQHVDQGEDFIPGEIPVGDGEVGF